MRQDNANVEKSMRRTSASTHGITLTNVSVDEKFCYSLPIIKGYVSGQKNEGTILLRSLDVGGMVTSWPVRNGNFKCLANLNPGRNRYVLEFENDYLEMNLEFQPKTTEYHVLPVYIICDGNDGKFQAPDDEDNSPESACRRISLGSRLIQSLMAEKLHERDMTRSTFRLARDSDPDMDCLVFHSKLAPSEVYKMEPEEIWEHFGRELVTSPHGSDRRKFLAFLSCTRYSSLDGEPETHEEVVARARGHVALGGGGLAVFGTGCLHTWPETIDQILPKFTDDTKVDKLRFMDDSCYRGTYGSCFSTTLGAVCHELGHAFDLGHSEKGIMGRGFDNINLVFTTPQRSSDPNRKVIARNESQHATVCFTRDIRVTCTVSSPVKKPKGILQRARKVSPHEKTSSEALTAWNPKARYRNHHFDEGRKPRASPKILTDDLTFWEKSCAVMLRYHKWFSDHEIPDCVTSFIEFDRDRKIVHSSEGIRVVELRRNDGMVLSSWEFVSAYIPKKFEIPLCNVDMDSIKMVVAEDSCGNIMKEYLDRP